MKPFTTSVSIGAGRTRLPMQVEGASRGQLASRLLGERIPEITIPEQNSLEMTWFARLVLASGAAVDLSGSSTEVGGWLEYGTVNVELVPVLALIEGRWRRFECESMMIAAVWLLVVEQGGYEIEAGLTFDLEGGNIFRVIAGEVPGSFLLALPLGCGDVVPQFSLSEYRRLSIDEV